MVLTSSRSAVLPAACAIWLLLVTLGSAGMWRYKYKQIAEPAASALWPATSELPRAKVLPTLLMFVHPRCTCSRASVAELAKLMGRSQGRVSAHVVFFRPRGTPASWARGELWTAAGQIPGVLVHDDEGGREAQLFHGETSGHAVLYDPAGWRLFDGGITPARGHEGESEGSRALLGLLHGKTPARDQAAVFGCPLRPQAEASAPGGQP